MKSERSEVLQAVPSLRSRDMSRMYAQCFLCRQWSWDASWSDMEVRLCLPCYVDVLEVRQARGVMGEREVGGEAAANKLHPGANIPGNSPSPFMQMDLFGDPDQHGSNRGESQPH